MFMQDLSAIGPEQILTYLNPIEFIKRIGTGHGIDTSGLVKSQEQVQQEQQQQQQMMAQQQMMDKLGPNIVNQGGQLIKEGVKQNAESPN